MNKITLTCKYIPLLIVTKLEGIAQWKPLSTYSSSYTPNIGANSGQPRLRNNTCLFCATSFLCKAYYSRTLGFTK